MNPDAPITGAAADPPQPLWSHGKARPRCFATLYGLSAAGDQFTLLALSLILLDVASASWIGALFLADTLPKILFAPILSPLFDRARPPMVVAATSATQFVCVLPLVLLAPRPAVLVVAVGMLSAGRSLVLPAGLLIAPALSPERDATTTFGRLEVNRAVGAAAGPAVAGWIVGSAGTGVALLVDALTYGVVGIGVVLICRGCPGAGRATTPPPWWVAVGSGFSALTVDRTIYRAMIVVSASIVFTAAVGVARVPLVIDDLTGDPAVLGLLLSAHTGGTLLGSRLLAPRIAKVGHMRSLLLAGITMGTALWGVTLVQTALLAVPFFCAMGVANIVQVLVMRSLIHHRLPAPDLGRAFVSSSGVMNAASAAGAGMAGLLLATLSASAVMVGAGVGTTIVNLVAWRSWQRRRGD